MATVKDNRGTKALSEAQAEALVSGYPGAALVVRADLAVVTANPKGAMLQEVLENGDAPEVASLVRGASSAQSVVVGTVTYPGAAGDVVVEVTVVPVIGSEEFLVLGRDLSLDRNLRSALIESRQRYKDLVEVSSDFSWEVGPQGVFTFVSPRGALGYRSEELVGTRPDALVVNPQDYAPLPFVCDHPQEDVEMWMRRADMTMACVLASAVPLYSESGHWRGARGVCRDVTEEREREAALTRARHREHLLNYVVNTIRDEVEPRNMLATAAAAAGRALDAAGCRIYRMPESGTFTIAAEHGDSSSIGNLDGVLDQLAEEGATMQTAIGAWQVLSAATHYRHSVNGAICMWRSAEDTDWTDDDRLLIGDVANQLGIVSEQITNHERIVKLSRTDDLTGLLNRRAFYEEELPRRLKRIRHSRGNAALFYMDLDNFKEVNDIHGHQRGDEALLFLRDILMEHSRSGDVIARLGGDEFVMWLDGVPPEAALRRAEELVRASAHLKRFSGREAQPLGLSIGVAVFDPQNDETMDELLGRADAAMYVVKRGHKGGFEVAAPAVQSGDDHEPKLGGEGS